MTSGGLSPFACPTTLEATTAESGDADPDGRRTCDDRTVVRGPSRERDTTDVASRQHRAPGVLSKLKTQNAIADTLRVPCKVGANWNSDFPYLLLWDRVGCVCGS